MKEEIRLIFDSITKYPGELRELNEISSDKSNLSSNYLQFQAEKESNARSYPRRLPITLSKAKGIYVQDIDGQVYYDCLSCAGTLALGHNHQVVQQAIYSAMESELPMQTLDIMTPIKYKFMQEILFSLPAEFGENAKIQFCSPSGSDAIEAAIKLVKTVTGRRTILALHGAYHGMTQGALGLMGNLNPKIAINGLMSEVHFLPYPYCHHCPISLEKTSCNYNCVQYVENILNDVESGIVQPAAIILEVIQGEGGVIPAPEYWLQELRRFTKEHNIPLVIDEVQTGLGRTGKLFAFEYANIIPDVLVLSKAIGGGLPLAIVIYNKKLDKWNGGAHAGTFRGNQLAMATGAATIRYIRENHLVNKAAQVGTYLIQQLKLIQEKVSCISDVRGKGLMIGIEISHNGNLNAESGKLSKKIQTECLKRGLIIEVGGRHSSVLRFLPPLTLTYEQVDNIMQILEHAILSAQTK